MVTRERLPKERLIRFVVGPDRALVLDLTADLPGRGMWLSASRDVLETARDKGGLARAFARAARGPVSVPADLPAMLEAALVRRISEQLGLARRAGQAVAGFEKAREWLRSGRARLVLEASDGSAAERARFLSGSAGAAQVVAPLPAAALGRMFGRDHVVHVAIAPGRLAERLQIEADRLAGLRGQRLSGHGPGELGPGEPGSDEAEPGESGPGKSGPGKSGPDEPRLSEQGQATAGLNEEAGVNG